MRCLTLTFIASIAVVPVRGEPPLRRDAVIERFRDVALRGVEVDRVPASVREPRPKDLRSLPAVRRSVSAAGHPVVLPRRGGLSARRVSIRIACRATFLSRRARFGGARFGGARFGGARSQGSTIPRKPSRPHRELAAFGTLPSGGRRPGRAGAARARAGPSRVRLGRPRVLSCAFGGGFLARRARSWRFFRDGRRVRRTRAERREGRRLDPRRRFDGERRPSLRVAATKWVRRLRDPPSRPMPSGASSRCSRSPRRLPDPLPDGGRSGADPTGGVLRPSRPRADSSGFVVRSSRRRGSVTARRRAEPGRASRARAIVRRSLFGTSRSRPGSRRCARRESPSPTPDPSWPSREST